jgi:tetratricopeptide (TPR) repeat protein
VAGLVKNQWIIPVVVFVCTFTAFLPALMNGFVNWDDDKNFMANLNYRGLGAQQLVWMFTTFHSGHYQPLSWVTLGWDYIVWGLDPVGYHLTNIILHSTGAVLFYFLTRRLLRAAMLGLETSATDWSAAFAALIFSVHPLRVESVAWVTERRDVLSGVFLFAAVLFYLRAAESGASRICRLIISTLFYGLSLLSKASGMTLPLVLVVLDLYPLRRLSGWPKQWASPKYRPLWLEKIPFLALAAIAGFAAVLAQEKTGALVSVQSYSLGRRIGQTMYAIVFYIWKTILPFRLSPLYQVPFEAGGWGLIYIVSGLAVLAVTALLFWKRKEAPALLTSWACYLAFVAPVSGIAQSGVQFVADRYSYLSCLSWAILAGAAVYKIRSVNTKRFAIFAAAALLLVLLAVGTWRQTIIWRDSDTLWRHAVAVAPDSSIAHYNLGQTLEAGRDLEGAMAEYREAIARDRASSEARYNLARLLARGGKIDEAISQYTEALRAEPKDPDAHNNLGLLLARRGDIPGALEHFNEAVRIDPGYAKAYYNLGRVMLQQGRAKEAEDYLNQALRLEPGVAEIHEQLARALTQQGKKEAAMRHYEEAVRIMKEGRGA